MFAGFVKWGFESQELNELYEPNELFPVVVFTAR